VYILPCFHLKGNDGGNNLTPRSDYHIITTTTKAASMLKWNTYGTHSEGMVFVFATQFFF
jgi:hypothetical protein